MLVVISDLHFEEEKSNYIEGDGTQPPIHFSRNFSAKAFRKFATQLAYEAKRNHAKHLDLVLAGDIFDIHRSGLWFTENPKNVRPYVSTTQVSDDLEAMILRIIDGVAHENNVRDVLEVFRLMANGRYIDESGNETDFPVPVTLHHIAGNHDRMVNATAATRRRVRKYLGLPDSPTPFERVLTFDNEQVLIRHGHEYDRYNFSTDVRDDETIPTHLPDKVYQDAPFGDFVTVDIASRLPHAFRQEHGDDKILRNETLRQLYGRLLEFDDLRPQRAMFNYFLHASNSDSISPEVTWRAIEPVILNILNDLHDHSFLHYWLDEYDRKGVPDVFDAVQAILELRAWRFTGVSLKWGKTISDRAMSGVEASGAEIFAAKEEGVRNGRFRFVVGGHTHHPKVALVRNAGAGEQLYLDTGTWRNQVLSTPDYTGFSRVKAMTYIVLYGQDEDYGGLMPQAKIASFDYWSGTTQRWGQSS